MTLCLSRWKTHVRLYRWRISVNRGGICMCDINALLDQSDDRWWVRWFAKLRCWSHKKFGITL